MVVALKKSHGVFDNDWVSLRAARPPVWAGNGRTGWAMIREREESENDEERMGMWERNVSRLWPRPWFVALLQSSPREQFRRQWGFRATCARQVDF